MPAKSSVPGARVGFPISPELTARTEAVIAEVRSAIDARGHSAELIAVILELTETGLEEYYLRPLERARAGLVARSTAKVGVATLGKGIPVMVRKVVGAMSGPQLVGIAEAMDRLLIRPPDDGGDGGGAESEGEDG